MESDLQTLRRDLARFERRVRAASFASLAAAVLVAVLWIGARQAQSQQTAVSARALMLVDDSGRQRIALASDTNGRPGIWVRDDAGRSRLYFGFDSSGLPLIALNDETGRPRASVGFGGEHSGAQLVLADSAGTTRAYLGFNLELRTPQIVFDDEHGKDRIYAGWTRAGGAVLRLLDEAGGVAWAAPGAPVTGTTPGNIHKPGAP